MNHEKVWSLESSFRQLIIYHKTKEATKRKDFNLTKFIEELDTETDFVDPLWSALHYGDYCLVSILLNPTVKFLTEEISMLFEGDDVKNVRKIELEILRNMNHYEVTKNL